MVESNPDIIYIATATGGVWKSVNGGLTWDPVFDDQPVHSTGAVAIFQPNPDIVWVGSGEGNVRNSVSIGNGVYRSMDGGKTWSHLGLEKTERIHRVVLHPTNPDVAWVAALGQLWGENADRGVFKTDDGGKVMAITNLGSDVRRQEDRVRRGHDSCAQDSGRSLNRFCRFT